MRGETSRFSWEVAILMCFWYLAIISGVKTDGKARSRPMIRLLMQWDIKMESEQDFSEFVVREFARG